jgi:hypothetical protein
MGSLHITWLAELESSPIDIEVYPRIGLQTFSLRDSLGLDAVSTARFIWKIRRKL